MDMANASIPHYTIALLKNQIVIRNAIIENSKNPEIVKASEYENADMENALKILEGRTP
jgi:hypothetical protein